jgi:hypothetical protein
MTVSFPHPEASAISGRQLTRLLARWADARRLDPHQVETIRLAARAAPMDLGFDWWWRLLDPDNGSVVRAAATRPPFAVAPRPAFAGTHVSAFAGAPEPASAGAQGPAFGPPCGSGPWFGMDTRELNSWPQEDAEYQPYLRLT